MRQVPKVILATGSEELDSYYRDLAEDGKIEVSARVYYREAVVDAVKRNEADILLLSAYLEGTKDLADVVFEARLAGLRVVFLAGDTPKQSQLIKDLIAMGVYDILFYGEDHALRVEDIDSCLLTPRTFAQVLKECSVTARPQAKKDFFALFRQLASMLVKKNHTDAAQQCSQVESSQASSENLNSEQIEKRGGKKGPKHQMARNIPLLREPAGNAMCLQKPVVAVWSPAACGKTHVSIILARALAEQGVKVGLVDLDTYKQAIHTYLHLPEGEDSLGEVLSPAIVVTDGPFGIEHQNIRVFSRDPELEHADIEPQLLERFIDSPKISVDIFVCDMPSVCTSWAGMLLETAAVKVVVVDPDPAHVTVVRRELGKTGCDYVVLNRMKHEANITEVQQALGRKPDCILPEADAPGNFMCQEAGMLAADITNKLRERMRSFGGCLSTNNLRSRLEGDRLRSLDATYRGKPA